MIKIEELVLNSILSQNGLHKDEFDIHSSFHENGIESLDMVAKGCVIVLLISLVIGVIWGYKQNEGWEAVVLGAIMFPLLLIGGIIILGLVVMGIMFLFS